MNIHQILLSVLCELLLLGAIYMLYIVTKEVKEAPMGHEDRDGFHLDEEK